MKALKAREISKKNFNIKLQNFKDKQRITDYMNYILDTVERVAQAGEFQFDLWFHPGSHTKIDVKLDEIGVFNCAVQILLEDMGYKYIDSKDGFIKISW